MHRVGYLFGIMALTLAALLVWFAIAGNERPWGYRIEIDRNSGLVRRTDFRLFRVVSCQITTNAVAEIATKSQSSVGAQWKLAVRRPVFRVEVVELSDAKLLHANTSLGMMLASSDLSNSEQSNLVKELLSRMKTNAPSDVEKWVNAQEANITNVEKVTNGQ